MISCIINRNKIYHQINNDALRIHSHEVQSYQDTECQMKIKRGILDKE